MSADRIHSNRRLGRREFLRGSVAVAAGAGLLGCSDDSRAPVDAGRDGAGRDGSTREASGDASTCEGVPAPLASVPPAPTVVEVQDAAAVRTDASLDEVRVEAMLLDGLRSLAGQTDIKQAWKTLLPDFAPSMRIGLKLNCLSPSLTSSPPLVKALVKTLVTDLGADAQKIIAWDRRTDEMTRGKLTEAAVGARVFGTVVAIKDPSGPGYEGKAECCRDRPVHLSRILTEQTDITINLALLKMHTVSGITGALKNVYGCIAEPGTLHEQFALYSPALYRLDRLRKGMRLHITEGLLAVTRGDTESPPDVKAGRILLSTDPLALDVHALAVMNKLRGALPPVPTDKLAWIDESARLRLGSKTFTLKNVTRT